MLKVDFIKMLKNNNMKIKDLKVGSVLSETSFTTVTKVSQGFITVLDTATKTEVEIGKEYAESMLKSADLFSKVESMNKTQLADLLLSSSRIAMSVAYYKMDKNKTQKAYKAEKAAAIEAIKNASLANVAQLVEELIENPITKTIAGDFRVMKGYHLGHMNDLGRLDFFDMEDKKSLFKQVDPRSIQYIIVDDVKYELKK